MGGGAGDEEDDGDGHGDAGAGEECDGGGGEVCVLLDEAGEAHALLSYVSQVAMRCGDFGFDSFVTVQR